MSFPIAVVFLAIRISAFLLTLTFLPRSFVPWLVRLLFGITLGIFFFPLLSGVGGEGMVSIQQGELIFSGQEHFVSDCFSEIIIGGTIGLWTSASFYVAILFSTWAAALLSLSYQQTAQRISIKDNLLFLSFLLFAAKCFFEGGRGAQLFSFFGRFLEVVPLGQSVFLHSTNALLLSITSFLGNLALTQALFIFLPVCVLSLAIDCMFVVSERFLPRLVTTELILSTKFPLLLIAFSLLLYPLAEKLISIENEAMSLQGTKHLEERMFKQPTPQSVP